jgi:hypothetical protein
MIRNVRHLMIGHRHLHGRIVCAGLHVGPHNTGRLTIRWVKPHVSLE